jgi:hypothetical protein
MNEQGSSSPGIRSYYMLGNGECTLNELYTKTWYTTLCFKLFEAENLDPGMEGEIA